MGTDFQLDGLIGSGRVAEVFVYGPNVIKLYRPGHGKKEAFREAANLSILEDANLHIPAVLAVGQFGDRWGIEMSRAPGAAFPASNEGTGSMMADLHWRIHQVRGKPLADLKQKLARNIQSATQLNIDQRATLLSKLESLPLDDRLCHGDFHPGNILGTEETPFVVDWLDATSGTSTGRRMPHLPAGVASCTCTGSAVSCAYSRASSWPSEQILIWLPVVAAAWLAENVIEEDPRLLDLATMMG